jgi:thiamine biosynthesis lipoprotein
MKTFLLPTLCSCLLLACAPEIQSPITISGAAQGTTYNITYLAGAYANHREVIDSIFKSIDQSLSTYQPGSLISRINRNETTTVDNHFAAVYAKARQVAEITQGVFDPTVAPLINAYGFGFTKREQVTPQLIDSLKKFTGYQNVSLQGDQIVKRFPELMLDFNAIAPGYTVDALADFLDGKGIKNYLIELGGEVRARGKKLDGSPWLLGIERPDENPTEKNPIFARIPLRDRALATSGNYKKFYIADGKKYSHIIDPATGYSAEHNLLSATVIAPDCMTADAYATVFMVMGLDRAKQFLADHPELQLSVFFIYDQAGSPRTYFSEKFPAPKE